MSGGESLTNAPRGLPKTALCYISIYLEIQNFFLSFKSSGRNVSACASSTTCLLDDFSDFPRQVLRLRLGRRLCIHTHRILRAACTRKRPSLAHLLYLLVDLRLDALGADQAALRIRRLEDLAVAHDDLEQAVGQVCVRREPLLWPPVLVREDYFHKQHVGERVADGLVDEVDAGTEDIEGFLLAWRFGLVFCYGVQRVRREDDGAMTVGLEVNANVKLLGRMMQILDSGGCAVNLESQVLFDVLRRSAVCVSGLNDANLDRIRQPSQADLVSEEGGNQCRDAVAIQKTEDITRVFEVVDNAVSVAIKGAATIARARFGRWRAPLIRLDIVGTALIENVRINSLTEVVRLSLPPHSSFPA